jgi:fucose permease
VLIATLFVGLLFGSLMSGPLVDTLGQRAALSASSAFVAVCLPLLAVAPNAALAATALGAIGLASATINTASNALSSELFPGERARRMNGIGVMVGLGGLAMPTATVLASNLVSWRAVVAAGGALAAIVAVVLLGVAVPPDSAASAPQGRSSAIGAIRRFWGQPGFAWFCLLILLGGGNEASMAGWTSSFLTASGFSASEATWGLASHWLGLILSRVLLAGRVDAAKVPTIIRGALLSALLLLVLVASTATAVLAVGPFLIGMAMALVMPTSLALAGERYRGNAGTLFGGLLTLAQVGGMVLPASIGLVAERAGVRLGMGLLVASHIAVVAVVVRAVRRPVT